jgi:hypothetical protein
MNIINKRTKTPTNPKMRPFLVLESVSLAGRLAMRDMTSTFKAGMLQARFNLISLTSGDSSK